MQYVGNDLLVSELGIVSDGSLLGSAGADSKVNVVVTQLGKCYPAGVGIIAISFTPCYAPALV